MPSSRVMFAAAKTRSFAYSGLIVCAVASMSTVYRSVLMLFSRTNPPLKMSERERTGSLSNLATKRLSSNAFLDHERTWTRKIREALGALILEQFFDKDEILTWYLNLCEFGPGIYGIKQAARHYFHVSPNALSINQSAHLVLVIPSPRKWSAGLKQKQLTAFGHKRFRKLVWEMRANGYISDSQRYEALSTGNFGFPIAGFQAKESNEPEKHSELEDLDLEIEDFNPDEAEPNEPIIYNVGVSSSPQQAIDAHSLENPNEP